MIVRRIAKRVLPEPAVRLLRRVPILGGAGKTRRSIAEFERRVDTLRAGMIRLTPQTRLSYFVLCILDHCNLRCKGCDHFAAIAPKRLVPLADIARDLARMSALFDGDVASIGVMGGEPLLHPELKEILTETRKRFPATRIRLVTNGILLMRQDERFWAVCRENDIVVVNTRYPIDLDHGALAETARSRGVAFEFYGNTGLVERELTKVPLDISGSQDARMSFMNCWHANDRVLLMQGKIYSCTVAPNVRIFNERFGTQLHLAEGDYLDIYQVENGQQILEFLCRPKPFCRYCNVGARSPIRPWERSKGEMSEWLA
ncbi:MAG: radical SAM protein [Thermoleophilia bacterium]|nr:radical SAM protein [Thermoleophilia bacterium]